MNRKRTANPSIKDLLQRDISLHDCNFSLMSHILKTFAIYSHYHLRIHV